MKKPWSISTTIRNPERIRDFLKILKILEGKKWTNVIQEKYQILLIQHKIYGYGNIQFYNELSQKQLKLMANSDIIKFDEAKDILNSKNYKGGGSMRGRQSFKPLEKMGLVFLDKDKKLRISAVGEYFLNENKDLGNIFLKSFLKWQLPNLNSNDFKKNDGFNTKPFITTLHLIKEVNKNWEKIGEKPVGLHKNEFSLFVPTLINYKDIKKQAQEIIDLRLKIRNEKVDKLYFLNYKKEYIKRFLDTENEEKVELCSNNLKEYADNIIRYFRLTRYIYLRGNGYYIDLENRRNIEINSLLESESGGIKEFPTREEYIYYLSDINKPELPWEKSSKLKIIIGEIINEINKLEIILKIHKFEKKDYSKLDKKQLKEYIAELREKRKNIQESINYKKSQNPDNIQNYIKILVKKIYSMENRPLILEKYITLSLNALNDALEIKPNYPVGDDNEPTNTAPGGMADIECFYNKFNSICEVTMLRNRSQWYNEGQPVMRHLREFEEENNSKESYCLFIAPSLHMDTIETFWMAINYGYKGKKQKIVPLSINQFVQLLNVLAISKRKGINFSHKILLNLYEDILNLKDINNSEEWIKSIPKKIRMWGRGVLK